MLVIQSKKLTITQKLVKLKITHHDHVKYITTSEFTKLTAENFPAILKRVNLESKSGIANFVKKTFDE